MQTFHALIIEGTVKTKLVNAVYKNKSDALKFMFIVILKICQIYVYNSNLLMLPIPRNMQYPFVWLLV